MKYYCGQRKAAPRTAAFCKIVKNKLFSIIFTAALLSLAESGFAQGFVNLDFESASLVPVPGDGYYRVQFAQAFPGWTGTVGGVQQTLAGTNGVFLDSSGISIIDTNYPNARGYLGVGVIQGNYTAILQAGLELFGDQPADTSLSQTGFVPAGTKSLRFTAYEFFPVAPGQGFGTFDVTLGGQVLSLTTISNALNYTIYGADVSGWAGQTAQLAFTVLAMNPHVLDNYLYLDAIQFSTQSIPEPSALALTALGALFLGFRRRRR